MLKLLIIEIHKIFPNIPKPYEIESNENAIILTFYDLLENHISIKFVLRKHRFRYYILNEYKEFCNISSKNIKLLIKLIKEKIEFSKLLKTVII